MAAGRRHLIGFLLRLGLKHGKRRIRVPDVVRPAVNVLVGLLAPERYVQRRRDARLLVLAPREGRRVLHTPASGVHELSLQSASPSTHQPTSALRITPTHSVDVTWWCVGVRRAADCRDHRANRSTHMSVCSKADWVMYQPSPRFNQRNNSRLLGASYAVSLHLITRCTCSVNVRVSITSDYGVSARCNPIWWLTRTLTPPSASCSEMQWPLSGSVVFSCL